MLFIKCLLRILHLTLWPLNWSSSRLCRVSDMSSHVRGISVILNDAHTESYSRQSLPTLNQCTECTISVCNTFHLYIKQFWWPLVGPIYNAFCTFPMVTSTITDVSVLLENANFVWITPWDRYKRYPPLAMSWRIHELSDQRLPFNLSRRIPSTRSAGILLPQSEAQTQNIHGRNH